MHAYSFLQEIDTSLSMLNTICSISANSHNFLCKTKTKHPSLSKRVSSSLLRHTIHIHSNLKLFIFNTTHSTYKNVFCIRRVEKEGSRRQSLCGLVPYHNNIKIYTQLLIGDNALNNHNDNILAMLLQSCKHMKTRNSC